MTSLMIEFEKKCLSLILKKVLFKRLLFVICYKKGKVILFFFNFQRLFLWSYFIVLQYCCHSHLIVLYHVSLEDDQGNDEM